jgi:hypothetical protein
MDRRLWTLLLLPPIAWAVHLQVCYALHEQACASNTRLMLWVVSLVLLVIVAITSVRAYTTWQSIPRPYAGGGAGAPEEQEPRPEGRAKFMALAAFAGSLFFELVILGQTIPTVILRPCD